MKKGLHTFTIVFILIILVNLFYSCYLTNNNPIIEGNVDCSTQYYSSLASLKDELNSIESELKELLTKVPALEKLSEANLKAAQKSGHAAKDRSSKQRSHVANLKKQKGTKGSTLSRAEIKKKQHL